MMKMICARGGTLSESESDKEKQRQRGGLYVGGRICTRTKNITVKVNGACVCVVAREYDVCEHPLECFRPSVRTF